MKNVKYKKIGMENFQCYKDLMVLDIIDSSLILICGPNGVGKSTLFDAIPFTHYGQTSKGLSGKDVTNERIGKNVHTFVEFSINDDNYKQDRYYSHFEYGNTSLLYKNNELIKKGSNEVREEIEKLLLPKNLFLNTILFSQQKSKSFFSNLSDSDQKEIFRKILQTEEFEIYQKETSRQLSLIPDKIQKIESEINLNLKMNEEYIRQNINLVLKKNKFEENRDIQIEEIKDNINNLEYKNICLSSEIKDIDSIELYKKLENINNLILTMTSTVELHKKQFEDIKLNILNEIKQKELEFKNIIDNKKFELINETNNNKNILSNEFNNYEKNIKDKINEYGNELSLISLRIKNNNDNIIKEDNKKNEYEKSLNNNKSCPLCKRLLIDKESINNLKKEITILHSNIEKLKKDIINDKNSYNTSNKNKINLEKELENKKLLNNKKIKEFDNDLKNEIKKIDDSYNNALLKLKRLKDEKINIETSILKEKLIVFEESISKQQENKIEYENKLNKFDKISKEIENNKNNLKNLNFQLNEKQNEKFDFDDYDNNINRIKENKDKINNYKKLKNDLKDEEEILNFWKSGFSKSGIESMLIDECLPYVNQRLAYYLEKISNGRYSVRISSLKPLKNSNNSEFRDKINLQTLDNQTLSNSLQKFSSGQERLVDIAIILSLSDFQSKEHNINFNILLFDEIFDTLDDDNILYVSKLLRNILNENKSIYLISHRYIDQIEADEILRIGG